MANEIVWFSSDEACSPPTLNNANGSLVSVLDACLVTGFGSKTVTSISVSAHVATLTADGHGWAVGRMIEVSGVTSPAGLNGRKKVLTADTNTVTFDAAGIGDGAATLGSASAKRSPLGWTKPYGDATKAIYARSDPAATAMLLRVNDTGSSPASATYARALMLESATGIDTYSAWAPTDAQLSGGVYWGKGANNSTAKQWVLVGDGRTFYLFTDNDVYTYAAHGALFIQGFGDLSSYRAGDAYSAFIAGPSNASGTNGTLVSVQPGSSPANAAFVVARGVTQIGSPVGLGLIAPFSVGNQVGGYGPAYPSPVDNGMIVSRRALVAESNATMNHPVRGHMRGLMIPYANLGNKIHRLILSGLTGFSGELLALALNGTGTTGCVLLDITGPWD